MKFFSLPSPSLRLSLPLLLGLLAGPACSDDEAAPAPVPDFGIAVSSIDGFAPDGEVPVGCDGRVAVTVTLTTSIPKAPFILRPANDCGTSKRCGYVRYEALDDGDGVLATLDAALATGLLKMDASQWASVVKVRASLVSGVDQTVILNKDKSEVTTLVTPTFAPETECEPVATGGQGGMSAGGAGGDAGATSGGAGSANGGAGGADTGTGGAAAGAAGAEAQPAGAPSGGAAQ